MIDRFFTTACTITTPSSAPGDSTTDDEGVPVVAAVAVETFCHVQPYGAAASERGDLLQLGRDEVRRARRFWVPTGTRIRHTSTVTIGDDRFSIIGDPDDWNVGSTGDHIACVIIRIVTPSEVA